MAHPSKEKGKRFEAECVNALTAAFGEPFQRVPNSGAFTGGKNRKRMESMSENQIQASRGDIISPDGWNVIWECKHYKNLADWMEGPIALFDEWWEQANADARKGDLVIVLFKQNLRKMKALVSETEDFQYHLSESWGIYRGKAAQGLLVCDASDLLGNAGPLIRERATQGADSGAQGYFKFEDD